RTATNHKLLFETVTFWTVSKAKSRCEVIAIGIVQITCRLNSRADQTIVWTKDEIRDLIVLLFEHAEVFITQTEIQRQIRPHFPVVLEKQTVTARSKMALRVGRAARLGIRINLVEE